MAGQLEFDFGVSTFSDYDDDGEPGVQIDSPGSSAAGMPPAEMLHMHGFEARHLDPDSDGQGRPTLGGGLLTVANGDSRHAFLLADPRDRKKRPKVRKGGSQMYGSNGSFVSIEGKDPAGAVREGSVTLSASYPSGASRKSHVVRMDVRKDGEESISIIHAQGQSITMKAKGSRATTLMNAKGDAWIETSDSGNTLAGKTKLQGSLSVGQTSAATSVALADPLVALLGALITLVAKIPGGADAASLATQLPAIKASHLKAT